MLDRLRRQVAISLLEDVQHSIGEVAFFLGYSEASAFHRAFRRWTGRSPQEFRHARGKQEIVSA